MVRNLFARPKQPTISCQPAGAAGQVIRENAVLVHRYSRSSPGRLVIIASLKYKNQN